MSRRATQLALLAGVVEATAVSLFFYQALCVLFSVLFGYIYDALFAELVSMSTVGLILILLISLNVIAIFLPLI